MFSVFSELKFPLVCKCRIDTLELQVSIGSTPGHSQNVIDYLEVLRRHRRLDRKRLRDEKFVIKDRDTLADLAGVLIRNANYSSLALFVDNDLAYLGNMDLKLENPLQHGTILSPLIHRAKQLRAPCVMIVAQDNDESRGLSRVENAEVRELERNLSEFGIVLVEYSLIKR